MGREFHRGFESLPLRSISTTEHGIQTLALKVWPRLRRGQFESLPLRSISTTEHGIQTLALKVWPRLRRGQFESLPLRYNPKGGNHLRARRSADLGDLRVDPLAAQDRRGWAIDPEDQIELRFWGWQPVSCATFERRWLRGTDVKVG